VARLFFALWPDDGLREVLARWSREAHAAAGGRMTQPRNLHMTLAFLGDTDDAHMPALHAAAAAVTMKPCSMILDRCAWWKHNHIVWAGGEAPPALQDAVRRLRLGLDRAGITFDHKAFVPHVTLLRKAAAAPLPVFEPLVWPVRSFVLVASSHDAKGPAYRVVGGPYGDDINNSEIIGIWEYFRKR
jgi:2'-5' RNA ligase